MIPITLIPGAPEHHDALLKLWQRAVEATHHFLSAADIATLERVIREVYLSTVSLTVALHDDAPVGFVGVSGDPGEPLSIEMLFVDPSAHGQGVGTALLEDVARAQAVVLVEVNEQNPGALGFYLARGFEQVGRSALDGEGNPFPLLHLRRETPSEPTAL
ncbi:GNAT family N-acetyltransferase [Galactobacter valiniphilus]|uniref:GNAT family N-acetyltransferase n=1 Tax=Galactobacter valiniphilus TaxID=2676122 RepID=UPI003735E774